MKVVILAGGLGTRLSEYTHDIPKPMVNIGGKPILWHIMKIYANFGFKDFVIATGYKSALIKEYFLNYKNLNSDFSIDLKSGDVQFFQNDDVDWKVTVCDTGIETMTGGRVKRIQNIIGNNTFLLTYGDGLINVDIKHLVKFHYSHKKMVTVCAVHPGARFGEIQIQDDIVKSFKEKPQTTQGWINGGFFVCNPNFFEFLENDNTILEKDPLEKLSKQGELMAYIHKGFWHCMDTKRDKDSLELMWNSGKAPWSYD